LTWWLLLAIDEQTGEGVGFTEVEFNPLDPHAIQQEGTAVVAAHRGHNIGLWLKAVMLERILAERRDSHFIRTGNANVNAQMLAINAKLGFAYAWQSTLWQLPIADARRAVTGAETPAKA
jgi:mycothiol synthase